LVSAFLCGVTLCIFAAYYAGCNFIIASPYISPIDLDLNLCFRDSAMQYG